MPTFRDATSNRIDPAMLDTCHPDHKARYEFAAHRINGVVLDAGCGFGYGTPLLCERADRVVGIDTYGEGIAYARSHYEAANVRFEVADLITYDPPEAPFDSVVCLEAIEHVRADHDFALALRRLLKPGGPLVISTPNRLVTSPDGPPSDPTHIREYSPDEFERLLAAAGFQDIELFGLQLDESVVKRQEMRSRLGRSDLLGIRRLLPARFKAFVVRLAVSSRQGATVGSAIATAPDQIAVAR